MKVRKVFWIGACCIAVPAASLLLFWGQEQKTVDEEQPARTEKRTVRAEEEPARSEESQVKQAEWMIAQFYDKVGARLVGTLANEKQPIRHRVRADKLLGKMKYPPPPSRN